MPYLVIKNKESKDEIKYPIKPLPMRSKKTPHNRLHTDSTLNPKNHTLLAIRLSINAQNHVQMSLKPDRQTFP